MQFFWLYMLYVCMLLLQLYSTLYSFMDHSLPGSSVHGFLQAGIVEWVAMLSSRRSSLPWDLTCISFISCIGRQVFFFFNLYCHLGSPYILCMIYILKRSFEKYIKNIMSKIIWNKFIIPPCSLPPQTHFSSCLICHGIVIHLVTKSVRLSVFILPLSSN